MAKGRSPNYPSLTLWEAIDKTRKVYKAENVHVAPRDAIAKALGYNTLNGASLTTIGALKRYGLLEDSNGGLRVSANAVAIIETDEEEDSYSAALKMAAFLPAVFEDLRSKFGENPPGDATIKKYLTQKGFMPRAADEAIRIYRDNLEFFEEEGEYNGGSEAHDMPSTSSVPEALLSQTLIVSMPRDLKVEVEVYGDEIKKEDIQKMRNQLDRWLQGLEEAFE